MRFLILLVIFPSFVYADQGVKISCVNMKNLLGKNYKLDFNKYYYFHPILSQSTRDEFADIPIPSSDEWEFIKQEYFVNLFIDS